MNGVPASQRVTPASFRVNNLHVEPTIGLVSGGHGSVRLEPRVMAVLQALAQTPGELVSRNDLLNKIWPGGTTYDEALTQCVYQLRQQLVVAGGDDCRSLITTIPKRGYLLEAEVSPIEPDPASPPQRESAFRWGRIWIAVAVLALLLGWAIFDRVTPKSATPKLATAETGRTQSIAVLPFLPLREEDRDPVLELGMADTLITRLSGMARITVRPVSSVRWFGALDRDAVAAGRTLGVDAVVDGSIQRLGEDIRVTVRLLRVADGSALWGETFNDRFSGIFAVQDVISERVASSLAVQLGGREREVLVQAGTSDTEAYQHYLQGRYHLSRLTRADLMESIAQFKDAVTRDPGYAQAWLGLASAQFRIPIAGEVPPLEYYPQAKVAAQKALEINPSLAEGYAMLGWIAQWYDWDWAASEAYFRRAIELNPNDTESHLGYAHLLSDTGRQEEAVAEVRRARELSPLYLAAAALEGGFLMRAQRFDEATQRLEEARKLDPDFWLVRVTLASVYLFSGRPDDAMTEIRAARQASGDSTWAMANEVFFMATLGRRDEAEDLLAQLQRRALEKYVPPYHLAVAYGAVGDLDAAMESLELAYDVRDPKIAFLGIGGWQSLHERPEFISLMQRTGLAEFFD